MDNHHSPNITSFVIRFVHEPTSSPEKPALYRGTIHHVQSNQEIPFTRWQDAVKFIQRFMPIDIERLES